MNQEQISIVDWAPAYGPSTAMVNTDTVLSCSLIAWLLAKLLPAVEPEATRISRSQPLTPAVAVH